MQLSFSFLEIRLVCIDLSFNCFGMSVLTCVTKLLDIISRHVRYYILIWQVTRRFIMLRLVDIVVAYPCRLSFRSRF